jgi:hypothetical protein
MLKPLQNLFRNLFLIALLRQYFTLGVEGGEDAPEPETPEPEPSDDNETPDDDGDGDPEPEAEPADGDDAPDPETRKEGRANAAIREQRERAQAERDRAVRAEALLEAERAQRQPVRQDPTFEQEEQRLRSPDVTDLEKWQIQANRELRASRRDSQATLFQAQDLYDRSNFEGYMRNDHPGLLKAYASKVEERLADARKNGGNPNRLVIFKLLYAEDGLAGKLKGAAKQAGTGNAGKKKVADVPRGQSPGARSDVQRGRSTASQKLRSRLEGKQI